MKRYCWILACLLCVHGVHAQDIVQVEYFIDTDPGFGSATQVAVTPDTSLSLSFTADLSSVSDGFHVLYVRARDDSSRWSLTQARPFLKDDLTLATPVDVTAVEYYVDIDPGFGLGTPVAVTPASDLSTSFVADLSGLGDGFHVLYVRARDADGRWSLIQARPFLKDDATLAAPPDVTAAEYYIDTDPGFGSGTPVPITPGPDLSTSFVADLSGLTDGFHVLYVRARDANGRWSLIQTRAFLKESTDAQTNVVAVEYYFVKDGVPTAPIRFDGFPPAPDVSLNFNADLSGLDVDSTYSLYLRGIDADGTPSLEMVHEFIVDAVTVHTISGTVTETNGLPVGGVTMSLVSSDGDTTQTTTPSDGAYAFLNAEEGLDHTVTPARDFCTFAPPDETFLNLLQDEQADFTADCPPRITLAPPDFAASLAQGDSTTETLTIGNLGRDSLAWKIDQSTAWLSAVPDTGAVGPEDSVQVIVILNATGLAAGTHADTLVVTSNDPNQPSVEVPVALTVLGADIVVAPASLAASLPPDSSITDTLTVFNTGVALLDWTIQWSSLWLSAAPDSNSTAPGDSSAVAVAFDATGLTAGVYADTLVVTSNDPNQPTVPVPVSLTVLAPVIALSDTTLDFGGVFVGASDSLMLTISNAGTSVLQVTDVASDAADFTVVVDSLTLDPDSSAAVMVTFTPSGTGSLSGTLAITSNDLFSPLVMVALTGEAIPPPVVEVTPASLSAFLAAGNTTTQTLTISNTGSSDLVWTAVADAAVPMDLTDAQAQVNTSPANSDLEIVLDSLNANFADIIAAIPGRFGFSGGTTGTSITNGGGRMYDVGNFISTNLGGSLSYSNNLIVGSALLGAGGRYVTVKYPGLFVLAADLGGVEAFEINGNLGADGNGSVDSAVLQTTVQGTAYTGFVKRVFGAGTPSVNHLVIVTSDVAASHTFSSNTNSDFHRVTGLTTATRLFYLLYAGTDGGYLDNVATLTLMNTFLGAVGASWLSLDPTSGVVEAGQSTDVGVTFDAMGLDDGTAEGAIIVASNDPITPTVTTPVTLTVSGSHPVAVADSVGVPEDSTVTFDVLANDFDPNGDPITLDGFTQPSNGTIVQNADTTFTYTPNQDFYGTDVFTYTISDSSLVASAMVEVHVAPINDPPQITSMPVTQATETRAYSYQVEVTDPDPDAHFFTLDVAPFWLSVDSTGRMAGTPPLGAADTTVTVTVSDDSSATDSQSFALTVRLLPDLTITEIQAPAEGFTEEPIDVTWTVTNAGNGGSGSVEWFDRVFLSPAPTFDPQLALLLGTFENLTALDSSEAYTKTATVTLPEDIVGNQYIFVETDFNDDLDELDEGNNRERSPTPTDVMLRPLPDLQVVSVITPGTALSEHSIDVTYTVQNLGDATASSDNPVPFLCANLIASILWRDAIYLSDDLQLDVDEDEELSQFLRTSGCTTSPLTGPLEVDSSYTLTRQVQLPVGISAAHYIFVVTDILNQVFEFALDGNNVTISDSIDVLLTPPPDLEVVSASIPDSIISGLSFNVSWTVKNFGPGRTSPLRPTWKDEVYLSADTVLNTSTDTRLTVRQRTGVLEADSSYAWNVTVSPSHELDGTQYLFIVADADDEVFEFTGEDNNIYLDSLVFSAFPPDLVVATLAAPDTAFSGQPINVSWTVQNQGTGPTFESNWVDQIYISTHPTFDPDSVMALSGVLHFTALEADSSYTVNRDFTLPDGVIGDYYLYARTDDNDQVFEFTAEGSNVLRSDTTVAILLSPWPDLQVSSVTGPASAMAGEQIQVSWTVENAGAAPAGGTSWRDSLYISTDPVFDPDNAIRLGALAHGQGLGVGASYTKTLLVTLPTDLAGDYYLHLFADASESVFEFTDEDNNVGQSTLLSVIPYPPIDLAVQDLAVPLEGATGQAIDVAWTVKNIGTSTTLSSTWADSLYLSADNLLNTSEDVLVAFATRNGVLAPGESYMRTLTVTLPNERDGDYFLIVSNTLPDSNPLNNIVASAAPIAIARSPSPDLVITSLDVPTGGTGGQPITVRWTMENQGDGATQLPTWFEAVYLSADTTFGAGDVRLGTFQRTGALNPGESYTDSLIVTLPANVSDAWYVLLRADNSDVLYEHQGEDNNVATELIVITQPLPSDLVVTSVTIPAAAVPGEDVMVSWTIENRGQNPAVGRMREAVYVSSDSLWQVEDPLLGVVERTINLAPGDSLQAAFKADLSKTYRANAQGDITEELPGVTPGDYFVIVRTDIRNNILESNEGNNTTASQDSMNVDVALLALGTPAAFTLQQGQSHYYRIEPSAGTDLHIVLAGNESNASSELYVAFDRTPTFSNFDVVSNVPLSARQEVLIPSVQAGSYFLLVHSRSQAQPLLDYTLTADSLSFEILYVDTDTGGNTGRVTTKIEGAKFAPFMTASLQGDTNTILADTIRFVNSTVIFATFNLTGVAEGSYDVVLEKLNSQTATLAQSFSVVPGDERPLAINIAHPEAIRFSTRIFDIIIVYSNDGNVDIPLSASALVAQGGASLGTSLRELELGLHSIPLIFRELDGPADVLRPGAVGTITVFVGSSASSTSLGFQLYKPVQDPGPSGLQPNLTLAKSPIQPDFTNGNSISSNGCGSLPEICGPKWNGVCTCVPDLNFIDACTNHDICYATCGEDKSICDGFFFIDMIQVCIDNFLRDICPPLNVSGLATCLSIATIYYLGVTYLGGCSFENAQTGAGCTGNEPPPPPLPPPPPPPPGPLCCIAGSWCFEILIVFPIDPNDQPFQGVLFRARRWARSLAVDTCGSVFSLRLRGGFFFGPRRCFLKADRRTRLAKSRKTAAIASSVNTLKIVQCSIGIAMIIPR